MKTTDLQAKFDELLSITSASYQAFIEQTAQALREERPSLLAVDEQTAPTEALQLDLALVRAAPVAVVPIHCEFAPLAEPGHRFLLAEDGLYLEVRRPWLHLIRPLVEQRTVRSPYGRLAPKVELGFGTIGTATPQLRAFADLARKNAPLECAASLIWNSVTKEWDLRVPEVIGEATGSRIQYHEIELADDEHLVIDLHSHGHHPAGFSPTDDVDDAGSVKFSGVYGSFNGTPTLAFRLCVLGLYLPIQVPADRIFGETV